MEYDGMPERDGAHERLFNHLALEPIIAPVIVGGQLGKGCAQRVPREEDFDGLGRICLLHRVVLLHERRLNFVSNGHPAVLEARVKLDAQFRA